MARKKYGMTEARIRRFIKEGRGKGVGPNYKPWHLVSDVPSLGRVHRPYSNKTHRQHHLFSDNEKYAHVIFDWNDSVTDIREQYPLLDRRETMEIAARCGYKHPVDPHSGALWVITTDFLLTVRTPNGTKEVARAVKQENELTDERKGQRVLEKLEIERRYWEKRGVSWKIITDSILKTEFTRNLDWICNMDERREGVNEWRIDDLVWRDLQNIKERNGQVPIKVACMRIDEERNYSDGESLAALRRLLWDKSISVDLNKQDIQKLSIAEFDFAKGGKK